MMFAYWTVPSCTEIIDQTEANTRTKSKTVGHNHDFFPEDFFAEDLPTYTRFFAFFRLWSNLTQSVKYHVKIKSFLKMSA